MYTLQAGATVADACEMFAIHRLLALPVVDEGRKLLGVVDVGLLTDEVFDLTERRLEDEVFQRIGLRAVGAHRDRVR